MKKTFTIIITALVINIGCKKTNDANSPSSGNTNGTCTENKTFSADVNPIIQSSCAISNCHNTGSSNGPGPLTNYQQVFNARASVKTAVENGTMPKNTTLSAAQKTAIICWIAAGATNN